MPFPASRVQCCSASEPGWGSEEGHQQVAAAPNLVPSRKEPSLDRGEGSPPSTFIWGPDAALLLSPPGLCPGTDHCGGAWGCLTWREGSEMLAWDAQKALCPWRGEPGRAAQAGLGPYLGDSRTPHPPFRLRSSLPFCDSTGHSLSPTCPLPAPGRDFGCVNSSFFPRSPFWVAVSLPLSHDCV